MNINQKALMEITPEITLKEAVILDAVVSMCNSRSEKIVNKRVNGMTWVDYQSLLKEMPILHSKSRSTITPKIKKLEKYGYIRTEKIERKKYVELTSKIDKLKYDNRSEKGTTNKQENKSFEKTNKGVQKSEQGRSEKGTNHYTKDTSTKNNKSLSKDKEEQSSNDQKKDEYNNQDKKNKQDQLIPVEQKEKKKKNSSAIKKEKEEYGDGDINRLLEALEEELGQFGKIYDISKQERKTKERQRAYNWLTAKKIKEKILDKFDMIDSIDNRIKIARRLIRESHSRKYIKKANNMQELYYNWAKIFNQVIDSSTKKKDDDSEMKVVKLR